MARRIFSDDLYLENCACGKPPRIEIHHLQTTVLCACGLTTGPKPDAVEAADAWNAGEVSPPEIHHAAAETRIHI